MQIFLFIVFLGMKPNVSVIIFVSFPIHIDSIPKNNQNFIKNIKKCKWIHKVRFFYAGSSKNFIKK